MNCQYCGKIFQRDCNLRRHEDEYCPNCDNDGDEASSESMETHVFRDDDDDTSEDTENSITTENSSEEEIDP